MKSSEVLNRAADLIKEEGWARDGRSEKGHCASNAINRVSTLGFTPAHAALMSYLGHDPGQECVTVIFRWNDADGRTATEVVEVLRAAAVIEAAREEQDAAWETYAEQVTA